jgi:BetI-type transcriptional repressor, C-terminal
MMPPRHPSSAKRAAREATQAAMLEAATRMLFEQPGLDVLAVLKPVEVARRCDPPRTTGAFYNIWPTQGDFRRDVLDHVLSVGRFQGDQDALELLAGFLTDTPSTAEMVRSAADLNFKGLRGDPAITLQLALWTQHASDPEICDRIRALYGAMFERASPLYRKLLERAGRRMVPPYTVEFLAVAVTALVEGLALRWTIDPDAVPDDAGAPPGVAADPARPWTLFSSLAYVLVMGMTEPVPTPQEHGDACFEAADVDADQVLDQAEVSDITR